MRPRVLTTAPALALVAIAMSGCNEVEEEEHAGYEPSKLEATGGDLKRVTFTAEGARRVGLQMTPIRVDGDRKLVPYEALIYDPDGKTWVYSSPKRLSFERQQVEVDRIDDDRVLLSGGPPAGTAVVTTGATEVYGAELEIAG